MHYVKQRIARK